MFEPTKDRKEAYAIISGYPRVAKSTQVSVIFHPTGRVPGTRFSPTASGGEHLVANMDS